MHANPQSPSAHMGSSATVTSTKTKRSQMLQMYYVGGITKSNPSPSQLSLAKDAPRPRCIYPERMLRGHELCPTFTASR